MIRLPVRACGLALVAGVLLAIVSPDAAAGQRARANRFDPATFEGSPSHPSAGRAFLSSALLPGSGQYQLGAGRWVAYVGIEAWAWINWADARAEAADLESDYRDLGWEVARRISAGRRQDREFEYYEAMSHYPASGSYDADPAAPGVQPEEDADTYNGDLWKLAREIFFPAGGDTIPPSEQERAAALEYYERKAIGPQYAWSWGSNQLEREQFRTLIRRSDEAARAGTTILGVILVNHVVSAVDALITARLSRPDGTPGSLRLRGDALPGPFGPTPLLVIEITTP